MPLCDIEEQNIENLDIHTFTCEIYRCNFCQQVFKTISDIKTHMNKDHNGNGSLRHFYCERGNQEYFQEQFHIARDLFKKK